MLFPYLITALKDRNVPLSIKGAFIIYLLSVAMTTLSVRHVSMFLPFMIILMVYAVTNYKLSLQRYINNQLYLLIMILTFIIVSFVY